MWKLLFLVPCVLLFAGCATSVSMQSLDTGSVSYASEVQAPAPATLASKAAQDVLDKVAASSYPVQWPTTSGEQASMYVGNTIFYGSIPCRTFRFAGPTNESGLACNTAGQWKKTTESIMRQNYGVPSQLSLQQKSLIRKYHRQMQRVRASRQ